MVQTKKLIEELGYKKSQRMETMEKLTYQYDRLVGDIILSSGIIVYLGAFNVAFRQVCGHNLSLEYVYYSDLFQY